MVEYHTVLSRSDKRLKPWFPDSNIIGVFNGACINHRGKYYFLIRQSERVMGDPDFEHCPYIDFTHNGKYEFKVNKYKIGLDCTKTDQRCVYVSREKRIRLTNISHVFRAESEDGKTISNIYNGPAFPFTEIENEGMEDPRISPFGDKFIISTVGVSDRGIYTLFRETEDLEEFTSGRAAIGPDMKDVVLFPESIDNEPVALTRPYNPSGLSAKPWFGLARGGENGDLYHWSANEFVAKCRKPGHFDHKGIGPGAPPIRTREGWLEVYHGVNDRESAGHVGAYSGGFMLFDYNDPTKIIARSRAPLFVNNTAKDNSTDCFVPNVFFATAMEIRGDGTINVWAGQDDANMVLAITDIDEVSHNINYEITPI